MQQDFRLIIDLVTVLAAAAAGGIFASLLRQPALLGYLLGGMVVGPAGLGWIKEVVQVETLAQFGVALLLFTLGVEFSFTELKKVKAISLGGGGLQIALTILVTTLVSLGMGWVTSPAQGIFLGAILSLSSTAVVLKCLMERNETATPHAQVMLGILVVQDLALGLMMAVLPALDQPAEAIGVTVGWALLRIGLFAAGAVVVGIWIVPRVLQFLARTESRELFLLGVVALCLGIALLTDRLGFSIEMGAFVAGLMISEVEYADQTLTYVEPLRDIFAALFFVSVGMLIDPKFLWNQLDLILELVALVFVGKFLIVTPIVRAFRYPLTTALIVGLGLAQIGEFSFVLASAGQALGLVSRRVYLLIVGTTAVTLVLTPFVLRIGPLLLSLSEKLPWLEEYLDEGGAKPAALGVQVATQVDEPLQYTRYLGHVVVCGYGRVGRRVVQLVQEHKFPVVVIDQSESRIQQLREAGVPYVYGNAASLHVLETAGVYRAQGMAIALPDPMSTRLCLKRSLELSPELDIVVQANQDKDIELLYQLGAREVVQPEFEASLELSTHLLTRMGLLPSVILSKVEEIRSSHYLDLRPVRSPSQVSRDLQLAAREMSSKWYLLPVGSPLTGMTLEETNLRRLTGVSLMAIRRVSGEQIDYPNGQTLLESEDRLLLVGQPEELASFVQLAKGEVAVPVESKSCQWVLVQADSPVRGRTLSDLDLRREYNVEVQAILREGKFIRFPPRSADIQEGDRVLLCGSILALKQFQRWMIPATQPGATHLPLLVVPLSEALKEYIPRDQHREL